MRRRNLVDASTLARFNEKEFDESELQTQSRVLNEVFSTHFKSWEQSVVNGKVMTEKLRLELKRPLIGEQQRELYEMLGAGHYETENAYQEGNTPGIIKPTTKYYWVYTLKDRANRQTTPLHFKAALGAATILFFVCVVWSFFHDSKYVNLK